MKDNTALDSDRCDKIRQETWPLFQALPMFFIRVRDDPRTRTTTLTSSQLSDFMSILQSRSFPHLHNVEIMISYIELPIYKTPATEPSSSYSGSPPSKLPAISKWKQDRQHPAKYRGMAPSARFYVNGKMIRENLPRPVVASSTPHLHRGGVNAVNNFGDAYHAQSPGNPMVSNDRHGLSLHRHFTPPDSITDMEDTRRSSAVSTAESPGQGTALNGVL